MNKLHSIEMNREFSFNSGNLALDFVNTVWERPGYLNSSTQTIDELLISYNVFLDFFAKTKLLDSESIKELRKLSEKESASANLVLKKIIQFRERFFNLLKIRIGTGSWNKSLIDEINSDFSKLPSKKFVIKNKELIYVLPEPKLALDTPLMLLIDSSLSFLNSEQKEKIKICNDPDCSWMFLDFSKNGSRVWCDMTECGNRAKAKRFYAKAKETKD